MFRNYIKIAFRNIQHNKGYSALTALSLFIGLTGFMLLVLHLENEWSYDRFHDQAEQIYRVVDDKQTPEVTLRNATTAAPVAPALLEDFPEIQSAVRIRPMEALIAYKENLFQEEAILLADNSFFEVFSFELLQGNPTVALQAPKTIVLTENMAKKYFGLENPIGQFIVVDEENFEVTGIIQDAPANSHFTFDFLVSMASAQEQDSGYSWLFTNWYSNQFYTYILLNENYAAADLEAKLVAFDQRHDQAGDETVHQYSLEALTDIYLSSDRDNQIGKTSSRSNTYILLLVAIFILLIAGINFVNLATARASERAREVGVKKAIGAATSQLRQQFLVESFLFTFLALIASMLAAFFLYPLFSNLLSSPSSIAFFTPVHLVGLLGLFLLIGGLSGSYSSVVLSNFKPSFALKSKMPEQLGIRKGLVVLQFSISIALILGSLVVYHQMAYMQNANLGFDPEQILVINFEADPQVTRQADLIKQELLQIPGVSSITASSRVPGDGNTTGWSMRFISPKGDSLKTEMPLYGVDENFLNQYQIPVVAGRGFSTAFPNDRKESMLINEAAAKALGFRQLEEAIGTKVAMYPNTGKVIGVFQDFHYQSLDQAVEPLAMRIMPFGNGLFSLSLSTGHLRTTIAAIEEKWKQLVPHRPIAYTFLEEDFNRQYEAENQFKQVLNLFTGLAILIACLGLLGLSVVSVKQRTKEIGIRKVLGASVTGIVALLSKDFIQLVGIAFLIATPIAYYFMNEWLQDFAYRIELQWWVFVLAGVTAIGIALLTVSVQSIRAALANPVESLRSE
ncbi:MAG: ABC transporter permease [Bacteroidota bacterium]